MIRYKDLLTENIVKKIKATKDPLFIMITGGSASGKNYWFDKNFRNIPLIDIDAYLVAMTGDPSKERKPLVAKAIHMAKADMKTAFKGKQTVAQVSTGGNLKGTENKLKLAKEYGMKTALIFIDTDPEVAIARNKQRVQQGGHGSTLPEKKIRTTNKYSREVFDKLKKSKYVDFSEVVKS